jgi:glycosyltransferase involved in cell wall biosynthesis
MDIVINGRFLTQRITGVQRYARELVQALDSISGADSKLKIIVMSPKHSGSLPLWRNVELRQVGHLQGHAWEQLELPRYSRGNLLFCPGNTAPVLSLLGGQHVIVTVHDLSFKYFPDAYRLAFRAWYRFLMPLVLHRANAVITVSESERQAIAGHYPFVSARLHAIPNGGAPQCATDGNIVQGSQSGDYVLYVGSLSKRKNFPRMLQVACLLASKRGFRFVFVGESSKSLVPSLAEVPEDVSSKVMFAGSVEDQAALESYYREAACFIFPSLYESSGLPPLEAMACGCPVIAADIPALRERCGAAALYCDPKDINSIAACIESVMDHLELRSKLKALGYERASMFTWERCARETSNLLCQYASGVRDTRKLSD